MELPFAGGREGMMVGQKKGLRGEGKAVLLRGVAHPTFTSRHTDAPLPLPRRGPSAPAEWEGEE